MLRLTWKNNIPLFSLNGNLGDATILYFGETNVDDIIVPEFQYHILLFEHNETWSAKAKLHRIHDDTEEPKVDVLVSELISALMSRIDFDFSKHWKRWKGEDSHFGAVVLDSTEDTWIVRNW